MRRAAAPAALALAGALALVACSGSGSVPAAGTPTSGGSSGTSTSTSGAPPPTAPAEVPVPGGVLRVGVERPHTLDPAFASAGSQSELLLADLLFDGLTVVPPGAAQAAPALAERWEPSADLRAWRFTLRPGAVFANGRPVDAADVKYSLERVARLGEGSPAAVRLEVLSGWAAFVSGAAPELAGIRVVDGSTVEFGLEAPLASFPELLSSPLLAVVPRESVEAAAPPFGSAPIGSGPFAFGGAEGDTVHLVRAPGGGALLDGIDVVFYDDAGLAYAGFAAGSLDWSPVPPDKVEEAADRFGSGGFAPFHAEALYGFNMASPKFADVRFRQAIIQAIDRPAIVRAVYFDVADPLPGLVAAGVAGGGTDACGAPCAYSPAGARALVAAAFPPAPDGSPTVPEVGIDYYEGANEEAVASIIETSLEAVGIPAVRRPLPFDQYQQFVSSGQQELFRFSWFGLYAAPEAFLGPLVGSGSKDNVTGFSDQAVDLLLAAARAEPDPAARQRRYAEVEQAVLRAVPMLPIAQFRTRSVSSARVRGLAIAVGGTFDGTKVWLAR